MVMLAGQTVSLAVGVTSVDVALPWVGGSLLLGNDGGVVCFVRWGVGVQVATVGDLPVLPGRSLVVSSGGSTHVAGVVGSGSTVLRVTGLGGSPLAGGQLPLDMAAGAAAGYSLRRLRAAYAGAAVNVRRSSDNATQDIGFAGNDFDVGGFGVFIGGGSGFINTWYDQSGNGRHAVQGVVGNQPQLVTGVAALGGRPSLLWLDNSTINLSSGTGLNGFMAGASAGLVSTVCNITGLPTGNDRLWSENGAAPNSIGLFLATPTTQLQFLAGFSGSTGSLARWQTSGSIGVGGHAIDLSYQWTNVANNPTLVVDGGAVSLPNTSAAVGSPGVDTGLFFTPGSNGGSLGFPGHIAEQIVWSAAPATMAAVRANQKAYWGTP